jgi:hypothetical protein
MREAKGEATEKHELMREMLAKTGENLDQAVDVLVGAHTAER